MKSTTFALGALMASVAIAQPHRQHMAKHHKRNEEVVWVTDYDYVTETAKVTTTIWVSEGFVIPTETPATPTPESSAAPSQTYAANQFFENASKNAPPTSTSSSVYVAPTPESTYVAPPPPSSTYVAPPPSPEPTSTYVAPAVVEAPSPAAVYIPEPVPATTSAASAAAATYSSPSSGSSGGECSSGSPCSGDITYYEAGLGACGETNDGNVDKVIALPVGMMGAQSNGNPFCGKTVTIQKGGKTVIATVVDKCMGCDHHSIDLSNAAFLELAEFDVGRTTATWWFN